MPTINLRSQYLSAVIKNVRTFLHKRLGCGKSFLIFRKLVNVMVRLFHLQELCLRLMGHNAVSKEASGEGGRGGRGGRRVLSFKHVVSLLLVASAQYPMVSYTIYNRDDMELVTACLSVVFTNMLTVIKIITFLVYKQDFWQMMQNFREMYSQSQSTDNKYVSKANKLACWLGRAYCISCCFTGLYFMLDPIVKFMLAKHRGVVYIRELPMPMKFPFNDATSPGYEVAFAYTISVTIVVVCYASAVDGLFISFAIHLRAHFQALQYAIRTTSYGNKDGRDLLGQEQEQQQHLLIAVVNYHVLLLSLANKLCLIYMPIVFGQFVITSLQVGVIIYQIVTHMSSIMALLVYLSFLGSILLQLFIYCYGGEIIKVESVMVSVAVQLSDWHRAVPKQRRSLALIMLRAQHQALIKAGFYEASLANFMAICRAALSFITLIQSIE
ncbi:odorant receptor 82a [Scaptodrosophila lebanonensis]|uniref:Odorant receptor n=1 Tax=Drosophila lebanonensis TaxID=7225 RepID=A0A6J2T7Y0_DROLE|nr:odorant receptor 82a [Scaptodrosophila lebanonensis]